MADRTREDDLALIERRERFIKELRRSDEDEAANNEARLCALARRGLDAAPINEPRVLAEIAQERERQISGEGWTCQHDDDHDQGELAQAAGCYALHAAGRYKGVRPAAWPWEPQYWKPKNFRRDLIRAAALIIAEIERFDRENTINEPPVAAEREPIAAQYGSQPEAISGGSPSPAPTDDLVARLHGYNPPDRTVDEQRQIAQDIAESAAALEAKDREIERLHERLEDSFVIDMDGNRKPVAPGSIPDGIACRDETIRQLEADLAAARLECDSYRTSQIVQDAMRYRWLREEREGVEVSFIEETYDGQFDPNQPWYEKYSAELDAAIDAAIAGSGK